MKADRDEHFALVPESPLDGLVLRCLMGSKAPEEVRVHAGPDESGRFRADLPPGSDWTDLLDMTPTPAELRLVVISGAMHPEAPFEIGSASVAIEARSGDRWDSLGWTPLGSLLRRIELARSEAR